MNNDVTSDQRSAMEKFVKEYETTTTDKLNFQFMDIRKDQAELREDDEFSCTIGQKPGNFLRNRYRDILPYNINRVEIDPTQENQDGYINASHIKYPDTATEYIASQAPLPETVVDFWHMICQYKIKVVLMLCQLVESFAPKCERYWPKDENETSTFADFSVTFVKEVKFNDFSHRTLLVKSEKYGELEVEQLHYTEWPDHGCPQGEKHVLQLVEQMNALLAPGSPILVHCSAGCGRTGTVIALNIIRELINHKKISEIDVKKLVLDLRRQRTSMVQTQSQYHLLHKCIAVYCKMALGIDTETKSPESSPESVKALPQAQPSSIDGVKKLPLKSPRSTNPFLTSLSTEKPTLTINTSNGTNDTTQITSTNPFYEDVANDQAVIRL
uniref:Protein-tyrosine-phosphatase n=1 Tax=Panagrolaimus sp. JU765 TaxID=591449 RepID=A0AC34R9Z0_9BILA